MAEVAPVAGIVLAGGRSRRMDGTEKAFLDLDGRPLIAHVVERLRPQVGALVISANGDPARFDFLGLPVVADPFPDFVGPLAGILAGLAFAGSTVSTARFAVTAPTDAPFLPFDLAAKLVDAAAAGDTIAVARDKVRIHYAFSAIPISYRWSLADHFAASGSFAVKDWFAERGFVAVDFEAEDDRASPFFNINDPRDLDAGRAIVAALRLPSSRS